MSDDYDPLAHLPDPDKRFRVFANIQGSDIRIEVIDAVRKTGVGMDVNCPTSPTLVKRGGGGLHPPGGLLRRAAVRHLHDQPHLRCLHSGGGGCRGGHPGTGHPRGWRPW
jgi:hypothetical protein